MEKQAYLEFRDIHKSFVGVSVLSGVSFSAYAGEVHGLLGGNGAGKSTLMNILGGLYTKDSGDIIINGKTVHITNALKAGEAGIGFVHQELKLFNSLSLAENIFMWRLPTKKPLGFVDDKTKNEEAVKWLRMVGLDFAPTVTVEELSIAEQQLVEIAKVLSMGARILILDEPTSSLTTGETKKLFEIIRQLKQQDVCIIYISHKFDEIFEICDSVTVLRDGKAVWTKPTSEVSNEDLTHAVIGRRLNQYFPQLPPAPDKDAQIILEAKDYKNKKLDKVSFSLRKGEILGVFGLVGAGRSELLRAVFGLDPLYEGETVLNGKPCVIHSPKDAMRHGIGFLTENRREEGLVLKMNIKHNLTMPILSRISIPVAGMMRFKTENKLVAEAFQRFLIKAEGPNQRAGHLSGGNQQKVVLSKWMLTDAPILLLDEPTRGVDIGAKAEIYELIVKLIEETGTSVILVSSEAPEILGMSHRILVMRDGKIIAEHANDAVTEEELVLECARGVSHEEQ
ncbi:MAG: sugar ABC transporter ATP-binding protein [Clostridia bacterium]|nr:sugar ABC transporter ATP-binding protein [Clostridia bacterium]